LEHVFYSDGNAKRISWVIQTNDSQVEQMREHADIYLDKIDAEQSKHIALHVGLFWGIGKFTIKNNDTIKVMVDSKSMYDNLVNNSGSSDQFINLVNNSGSSDQFIATRTDFIKKFIVQRKLNVNYHLIDCKENLATKLL
jgi:hypothetical protein